MLLFMLPAPIDLDKLYKTETVPNVFSPQVMESTVGQKELWLVSSSYAQLTPEEGKKQLLPCHEAEVGYWR